MRPVDKGTTPNTYTKHGDARHDLAAVIGYYCSYCEMGVTNMIEVEHVHPVNKGGKELNWNNFLLSCKYCNTIKSDDNIGRAGYLWPDQDNTDLVFDYSEASVINPKRENSAKIQNLAQSTIDLMGLDRIPGGTNEPTEADTRWRSSVETWASAKKSFSNWKKLPVIVLAEQIAETALVAGHYSIWQEVFSGEQTVIDEIDKKYIEKGLYKEIDGSGQRKLRVNGII